MKKILMLSLVLLGSVFYASAKSNVYSTLGVSNNNSGYVFLLTGASFSNDGSSCSGSCYGSLYPNAAQWVNLNASTSWADLEYDVCNGTNDSAINYNGATPKCATYMGHVGISLTPSLSKISNTDAGTADIGAYSTGNPFAITFHSNTVIQSYTYPTTPTKYTNIPYRGVNLSGGEYDYAFQLPSLGDGAFYAQSGMNTIRLPFKWEYLQSTSTNTQTQDTNPSDPIDFVNNPNAKAYAALVNQYLAQGMTVIIDMHNYMRYGAYDDDSSTNNAIIGSGNIGAPTQAQYAAAWLQIGKQFANESNVIFDLMNEPNTMSTQLILDNYNAVLSVLRQNKINNLVLLEGNSWTGAWSWTSNSYDTATPPLSNAQVFVPSAINDSYNNYAINVHQYFDSNYSGTTNCVNSNPDISGLVGYLNQYSLKAMVTELGGNNTQVCATDINNFLSSLSSNYFIGWTGWVGGQNAASLYTYFGPFSDGTQTVTMTGGFGPNLSLPNN